MFLYVHGLLDGFGPCSLTPHGFSMLPWWFSKWHWLWMPSPGRHGIFLPGAAPGQHLVHHPRPFQHGNQPFYTRNDPSEGLFPVISIDFCRLFVSFCRFLGSNNSQEAPKGPRPVARR